MDVKKTYKADLDNRRVSGFLLGLVVALSVFLVALEFTTLGGLPEADDGVLDDVSQDIEMVPAVNRENMVAASRSVKKGSSDRLKVVERKTEAKRKRQYPFRRRGPEGTARNRSWRSVRHILHRNKARSGERQ